MIDRNKWEEMWESIATSVSKWRDGDYVPNYGKVIFEDGSKAGAVMWQHHYSLNHEGIPFNNLSISYSPLKEDNKYFLSSKIWEKKGSGRKCDISGKEIEKLRSSVEKFLLKEIEIK